MADSNDNGNPRGTLPKEVWQDLKALLGPDSHFHGTYTLIFSERQNHPHRAHYENSHTYRPFEIASLRVGLLSP